jgi:CheY-like chemotaxis protein
MSSKGSAKKTILVVDDDRNITELTQIILETAGYNCRVVNSGRECIKVLEESRTRKDSEGTGMSQFDLILLDVAMPGFSGIDVVANLKKQNLFPLNRVVFFTASSSSVLDEVELKRFGVLDCFKKPFKKPDLLGAVQRYVTG